MTQKLSGPELLPTGPVKHAVIFLHGLGSNGDDLIGLAPMLAQELPNTAFLSPNAPLEMPFATNGYQWFEYWDRTPIQILAGVANAVPMIVDYIHATAARFNIGLENIILCGFSQGTMMSLHVGLRKIAGLGGIVGFAGLMLSPETLALEKVGALPPVLLVHGLQDMVVPALASQQAELTLKMLGGNVKLVTRPMLQHSIDDVGIKEAILFSKRIFGIDQK